nr:energy-coupling factor transporter transmembrane component T [Proteiniborus sp. DW1]
MQQLKLPYVVGYSTLTAYRFLPTFKDELEKIRLAHVVRGIEEKKGFFGKTEIVKRYFVPMLATAIRKGEKVVLAMESKAFGTYKERTFYKEIKIEKLDKIAMVIWFTFCLGVVMALKYFKVLKLGTGIGA